MHANADKGPQRFTGSAPVGLPALSILTPSDRNVSWWKGWGQEWRGVKCARDLCSACFLCCYLHFLPRSTWIAYFIFLFTKLLNVFTSPVKARFEALVWFCGRGRVENMPVEVEGSCAIVPLKVWPHYHIAGCWLGPCGIANRLMFWMIFQGDNAGLL